MTLTDDCLIIILEDGSIERVLYDAQYLVREFLVGMLRRVPINQVELLVESNQMILIRLEGSMTPFWSEFKRQLVTTGAAATMASVLIPLADQAWSWEALFWAAVAATMISLLSASVVTRTVREVALRGVK